MLLPSSHGCSRKLGGPIERTLLGPACATGRWQVSSSRRELVAFSAAVSAHTRSSQWAAALWELQQFRLHGFQIDVVLHHALGKAYEKAGFWRRALATLAEASSGGLEATVVTFGIALSSVRSTVDWAASCALLEGLSREKLQPNSVLYNTALAAAATAGKWEHAFLTAEKMRGSEVLTDRLTLNTAASACDKKGEWKWATRLLCDAARWAVEVQTIAVNAALSSLAGNAAAWRSVERLWSTLEMAAMEADIVSCGSTVAAAADTAAWAVSSLALSKMEAFGLRVNVQTLNAAMKERTAASYASVSVRGQWFDVDYSRVLESTFRNHGNSTVGVFMTRAQSPTRRQGGHHPRLQGPHQLHLCKQLAPADSACSKEEAGSPPPAAARPNAYHHYPSKLAHIPHSQIPWDPSEEPCNRSAARAVWRFPTASQGQERRVHLLLRHPASW
eukprot:TRINITY_DN32772_c0_g4_i3.p1 TRINITY_DN32772_c0_g4~~TRINITY_DN32772_c0_g4_i3.p1  ORF type:complete len:446 (-),score=58.19 TRINITY_DN32772_c0_g4_i3:1185-2522(-)